MKNLNISHKNILKFVFFIFIIDIAVIGLHTIFSEHYSFFNLDIEHNLPTVYQFIKLNITSVFLIIASILLLSTKQKGGIVLAILAIGFNLLAIDELGQIHENASFFLGEFFPKYQETYSTFVEGSNYNSTEWLIIYLPIMIAAFALFIIIILKLRQSHKNLLPFLGAGVFCFILVPILEFINTSEGIFFGEDYNTYVIFEEGAEIFGASFFLLFATHLLINQLQKFSITIKS